MDFFKDLGCEVQQNLVILTTPGHHSHSCPFIVATDTVLVLEARHLCWCHFHELHFDWNTNRLLAQTQVRLWANGWKKHHNSESPNALMFRSTMDILHGYEVFADVWMVFVFTLTSKAKIFLPTNVYNLFKTSRHPKTATLPPDLKPPLCQLEEFFAGFHRIQKHDPPIPTGIIL